MLFPLLAAIPVSLLPAKRRERLRNALPLAAATGLSGAIQLAAGAGLFLACSLKAVTGTWGRFENVAAERSGNASAGGLVALVVFATSPLGIFLLYLALEGVARTLSGFAIGEPLASGPVWVLFRLADIRRPARALPPDAITRSADGILIDGAAPTGWDELTTIENGGQLFRVAFVEERPEQPLRFRTHLAPIPDGWIVRRRVVYPC